MKTSEVVRRTISRGVKCSPAVSFELAANLQDQLFKHQGYHLGALESDLGVQVHGADFCTILSKKGLASRSIEQANELRATK